MHLLPTISLTTLAIIRCAEVQHCAICGMLNWVTGTAISLKSDPDMTGI